MTALDTRLLEWLESWAKARGWWESEQAPGTKTPWTVGHGRGGRIAVWHGRERWDLDLDVAWLWAHAVDTGREVRRRCPDCFGAKRLPMTRDGWEQDEEDEWRPCPTCSTTAGCHGCGLGVRRRIGYVCAVHHGTPSVSRGYLDTPLARVVCEAAPREALKQKFGEFDHGVPSAWDPDFDEPGVKEHVRAAWKPVDEWSRRWAWTPWHEVWACLTMRRALRRLVREVSLRDDPPP